MPPETPTPSGGRRRRRPGREPGEGVFGSLSAAALTVGVGLLCTPFTGDGIQAGFLWFVILPCFVAPVVSFLLWFLVHEKRPYFALGAVIFGTIVFLMTTVCMAALGTPWR
jgi:hypothetical protein